MRSDSLAVAVLTGPGLDGRRGRALEAALLSRLSRARDLDADAPEAEARRRARARAEDALTLGLSAFARLDLEAAEPALASAIVELLRLGADAPADRRRVAEGAFAYGAVALYDGRGAEALGRFVLPARLDPTFRPEGVPDHVADRYDRVVATLGARRAGALRVGSRPGGAEVIVDGAPRGRTPVAVEGLAEGLHALVLDGATVERRAALVWIEGGGVRTRLETLEAEPPLQPRVSVAEAADPSRAPSAARRLGVDHLLALRPLPGGGVEGAWVRSRPGGGLEGLPLQLERLPEDPALAADLLLQGVAAAEAGPAPAPAAAPIASASADAPLELPDWWVWVAVGGAVLAGGIAGAVALASDGEPSRPPSNFPVFRF